VPRQPRNQKGSHHARREARMIRNATQHHDFIGKPSQAKIEEKPNVRIPRSTNESVDLFDAALGLMFAPARLALKFVRDVARLPGAILHVLQQQET
jgi:hypothetical protein